MSVFRTVAAATALGLVAAGAQAAACDALAEMKIEATNLLSSERVPAGGDLPGYCRVLGYVRPAINFEIRLPTEDWNGKFYMVGCGGLCGTLDSDRPGFINAINYGLKRNYAVATTDGGHWGSSSLDGRWAKANPVAEADWGWRAVQETTRVGKTVTEAFYQTAPTYSYFQGCSTGGRQAHMAALRQPEDFDGILSGAPALDYTGLVGTHFAWIVQANTGPDGRPILTPQDAPVIQEAVLAACDTTDGVADGMISNHRQCDFDPDTLDLAPEKIEVLQAWYSPPVNAAGAVLHPAAVPPGSEAYWGLWLTGFPGGGGALVPGFGANFLKYMAFPDDPPADYTAMDFDFDTDPARMAPQGALYNADDPDLSAFRAAGGKLLIWHGEADAIVFPGKTLAYFDELTAAAGGRAVADEFARLFMVPGMDHCGILGNGPGIGQGGFDPLTALETWVEEGTAPDRLLTTKSVDGAPVWSRPVCAHPAQATWSGQGDWADPATWSCAEN